MKRRKAALFALACALGGFAGIRSGLASCGDIPGAGSVTSCRYYYDGCIYGSEFECVIVQCSGYGNCGINGGQQCNLLGCWSAFGCGPCNH